MSKHSAPPPELSSAFKYIDVDLPDCLTIQMTILPARGGNLVYCSCELVYRPKQGVSLIGRRFGETASAASHQQVQGALFRACFKMGQYLEGKSAQDLLAMCRWELSMLQ